MQNLSQSATNSICPVCGAAVDEAVPVVIDVHTSDQDGDVVLRIGTCGVPCRAVVAAVPDLYFAVAIRNRVAVGG